MENLFNTFSFNVWDKKKDDIKKEHKERKRRKKQVQKLKEYLETKSVGKETTKVIYESAEGVEGMIQPTQSMQQYAPYAAGGVAGPTMAATMADDSSDDGDNADALAELGPEAHRRKVGQPTPPSSIGHPAHGVYGIPIHRGTSGAPIPRGPVYGHPPPRGPGYGHPPGPRGPVNGYAPRGHYPAPGARGPPGTNGFKYNAPPGKIHNGYPPPTRGASVQRPPPGY